MINIPYKRVTAALAFVSLASASGITIADQSPALDRVSIWLGAYYPNVDTNLGANYQNGLLKGNVNLERELRFQDHKIVPRARLDFLIGDSQGFSFDYTNFNRTQSKTLGTDVSFGGHNYDATATVRAKLNFDMGSAAYRWWFGHSSDVFGVGLGAAYYRVNAGVSGQVSVNGINVGQASTTREDSAWAPMLQLGWRHAFNDSWRMYADASGVKKNGGNLNGHIYNAALGLEWFPWHNVGVGAEYDYTKISLNQDRHTYDDDLRMRLNGPSVFLRLRF